MKHQRRGFSLIELLIVIGIMATIIMASFPSIMNMLETRLLDTTAREIQVSLQVAKFQAVITKIAHRVLFLQSGDHWDFWVEREATPGNWVKMHGYVVARTIPTKFVADIDLPATNTVTFASMGMITDFAAGNNSMSLQSRKLQGTGLPDVRTITVFQGGTIQYNRSTS